MGIEMTDLEDVKGIAGAAGKPQFSGEKTIATLKEVSTLIMGQSPSSDSYNAFSNGLPFYQGNADFGEDNPTPRIWCTDPKKIAEKGDILISVRAPIGAINIASEQCCIGRGIAAIRPNTELASRDYLRHQLRASRDKLEAMGTGSTFKAIGKKALGDFAITIYPKKGQEAIACQFNWVADHIKLANSQLAQLDNLVKSRFNEMFEGVAAERQSLPSIVWFQEGPGVRNHQYTSHGVKLLNVANLRDGKLDTSNTDRYISETEAFGRYRHFIVDAGDLIIASSGIKVEYFEQKMGFANKDQLPLCMNTSTIRFKPIDPSVIDMQYFMYYLKSEDFKRQLERNITGSAQLNFGPSHLKRMTIPVPSIMVQKQFSQFLRQVDKLRFMLLGNPSPMFGHRSFCCSTNSGNGGVILGTKKY